MPRIGFSAARHGFHFSNQFVNHVGPVTTTGLCGGMALAAARYFVTGIPIPTHRPADFPAGSAVPPEGTPLQRYIYDCQMESYGPLGIASAANWVVMPWVTFDDQFAWTLGEFGRIKAEIDRGNPAVLGLRVRQQGNPMGHQVLAIGYDENPKRIYLYDPNFPDFERMIRLDEAARLLHHTDSAGAHEGPSYSSVFITGCTIGANRPPYLDLGLQAGIAVLPEQSPSRVGRRVEVDLVVHNFGAYPACVQQLYVYVRGPRGENLDGLLGGGDGDATPIPPGGERRIHRVCERFGDAPGSYTIGASYRSLQGEWINLPAVAGGTNSALRLDLLPAQPLASPSWFSLGGTLTSPPSVGANADGRLEVFGRGLDSRVYHLLQNTPNVPNDCSGWEMLPGDQTFRGAVSVVRNNWDKIEIFARGRDDALYHRWQNEPNARRGQDWAPWSSLGGILTSDPTAALNADKRIEVFALGTDSRVYHCWQQIFTAFGASWSGLSPLGTLKCKGRVAAGTDAAGRLHVIARALADDAIWVAHQLTPGGPWSDWMPFGGVAGGDPALEKNADGRLEIFVRGTDGRVFHKWQIAPNGAWSGFEALTGPSPRPVSLIAEARVTTARGARGQIEVFAQASSSEVLSIHETGGSPPWSDWAVIGANVTSDVAAGVDPGGTVELFALGPNRELMHHWFTR